MSDIGNQIANEVGKYVGEKIPEVTHDQLVSTIEDNLIYSNQLYEAIIAEIKSFLVKVRSYDSWIDMMGTISTTQEKLKRKKDMIYKQFFEIQNLINAYIGQKIIMTYVHVDDSGKREIRISENNVDHIQTVAYGWSQQMKLSYVVDHHYALLKQSIPPDEESNVKELDRTVEEIDRRYHKYTYKGHKHLVLWKPVEWEGALLYSQGPINEAYVNMYIHNIQLLNSLEHNIGTFMTGSYGAIQADATRGFLIGDVRMQQGGKGGIQYAVKGAGGSPQAIKEVIKAFEELESQEFSEAALHSLIEKFTTDEENRRYKPQVTTLTKETMQKLMGETIDQISKNKAKILIQA